VLAASMALTGVGASLRLPKVVYGMGDVCGEADAELEQVLHGGCEEGEGGEWMMDSSSGRWDPVAPQLHAQELQRMHAHAPAGALFVQARRM
jgi:hypothetical protein